MSFRLAPVFAALAAFAAFGAAGAAGCGKQIGDACVLSTDCDPNGTRECDADPVEKGGYCTIQGCDYDTCPGDSECVRFFTGQFDNRPCVQATEDVGSAGTNDCSPDELCDLDDHCAARSSEVRYCMATCQSAGDCRDGYECRDLELMKDHGGEPILPPGQVVDATSPKFCASLPPS